MRTRPRRAIVVAMNFSVLRRPALTAVHGRRREAPDRAAWTPASGTPGATAMVTVTGPNRPETVAELFAALAWPDGTVPALELTDVGQVVMHGRLVLVVGVRSAADAAPWTDDALMVGLGRLAADVSAATGAQVEIEAAGADPSSGRDDRRYHVMLLGQPVSPDAVGEATRAIAVAGGTVEAIWQPSDGPLTGVELVVSGAEPTALCTGMASVAAATGADVAVQQADPCPASAPPRTPAAVVDDRVPRAGRRRRAARSPQRP
jgi:phosphoserine phosphatase